MIMLKLLFHRPYIPPSVLTSNEGEHGFGSLVPLVGVNHPASSLLLLEEFAGNSTLPGIHSFPDVTTLISTWVAQLPPQPLLPRERSRRGV